MKTNTRRGPLGKDKLLMAMEHAVLRMEAILDDLEIEPEARAPGLASSSQAFQAFMERLAEPIKRAGPMLEVTENVAWVKIRSRRNGHRVYVAKGKLSVGRIDCTLPPEVIEGAVTPIRRNGNVASYLPPTVEAVTEAITILSGESKKRVVSLE